MNKEDIIKLAQKAGFDTDLPVFKDGSAIALKLAALVAAAEREKVAAWMMQRGYATGHGDTIEDLLKELEWQITERVREACAALVDANAMACHSPIYRSLLQSNADAIRARWQE